MTSSGKPRLSVDLEPDQAAFLDQLPHGWKKLLVHSWIEITREIVRKEGAAGLMKIAAKKIDVKEL